MKRTLILLSMLLPLALCGLAQTLVVRSGSVSYSFPAAQVGEIPFADASSFSVMGKSFAVADVSEMLVDDSEVEDNSVSVVYADDAASVFVAGNVARYLDVSVSGAMVSITQSDEVGDDTCGEISYSLSGSSDQGQFQLIGSYKASIALNGLSLSCPSGAPVDIQNGKRVELSIKQGTVNTLADAASGSQKGCIACTGHLELKGKGSLSLAGSKSHAIYAKEYVTMKNCSITITGAVKDGINCNQYFSMESGTLVIDGVGDDCIQVAFKDDTDREAEDTGSAMISGGSLTLVSTARTAKGIKADSDIVISGGSFDILVEGGGEWDAEDLKTKAAACLGADGNISISDGTFILKATGSGGKGVNCDGNFTYDGGDMTITTTGGLFVYQNGTSNDNYTGNADNINSDYKSSPKGIKVDGDVVINGGKISVSTSGNAAEGIESKSTLTINDGTIIISSYDDAINSSSHMYIKGGDVTVVAAHNDGLDSNGNVYIEGGVIRACGASSPECGIDANTEQGYSVYFTGGQLLALGGSNTAPSKSGSTQPYVTASNSAKAGDTVTIKDSSSTVLASFVVPDGYSSSSSSGWGVIAAGPGGGGPGGSSTGGLLITCPGLTSGQSYTITIGSTSTTATAKNP
ncbi:MAG: carbohydrate-binding domain-containing protein [Lepagella sp.]